MHPEIKKFWEDQGYTIKLDYLMESDIGMFRKVFWIIMKGERIVGDIGRSDNQPHINEENAKCVVYFFETKQYTEEEMLKIIKLKAFL